MKAELKNGVLVVYAEDVYEGLALKNFSGDIEFQHNLNDRNQWIGPARKVRDGGLFCLCRRPILSISHPGCDSVTYQCECGHVIQADFKNNAVSVLS